MRPSTQLHDDGLITPIVGDWAEEKYRLVHCYADIFSTSMKKKFERRIYVDLFSGAGQAKIRGTGRIIPTAPLLVTTVRFPFDRYIFCELDEQKISAVKRRIERVSPDVDVSYIHGDSNASLDEITSLIPKATKNQKVLTFCLVDPYRMRDLRFSTLEQIAKNRFVDFLVLIPSGMDASRNRNLYLEARNIGLDQFLGRSDWRHAWSQRRTGQRFAEFVVDQFGLSMRALGYKYSGLDAAHLMTTTKKRLPIYHLVMFSRHNLGGDFWGKCRASSKPQKRLF